MLLKLCMCKHGLLDNIACVAGGMASAKARNKVLAAEPP